MYNFYGHEPIMRVLTFLFRVFLHLVTLNRNYMLHCINMVEEEWRLNVNKTDLVMKQKDTSYQKQKNKQTPWPLVRERTIPTDRPPLVDEI
jgi:hypothetical protein